MTWGARSESGGVAVGAGAPLPPNGKPLGKLSGEDLKAVIEKGFKHFSKLSYTCSIVIFVCNIYDSVRELFIFF